MSSETLAFPFPDDNNRGLQSAVAFPWSRSHKLGLSLGGAPQIDVFVGRETELEQLEEHLKPRALTQNIAVLSGNSGIGKTQLSLRFARQHRDKYSSIIWINAQDQYTLRAGLVALASRLLVGIEDNDAANKLEDGEAVLCIQKWLSVPSNTKWLVIFDNYDDSQLPNASSSTSYNISLLFPPKKQGSILIITRSWQLGFGTHIRLYKPEKFQEGLEILAAFSIRVTVDDIDAANLARRLRKLPIALSMAGRYINQTSNSFGKYMHLYNLSWTSLADPGDKVLDLDTRTIYATCNLCFQLVQEQDPEAAKLLCFMAYLGNFDLWYELFQNGAKFGPPWLLELVKSKARFHKAMMILQAYSLVEMSMEVGVEIYSLHTCVHDWMLEYRNAGTNTELYRLAVSCLKSYVVRNEETRSPEANRRLTHHVLRLDHIRLKGMIEWTSLEFGDIFDMGYLNDNVGRLVEGEAMYQQALQMCEKVSGLDNPLVFGIILKLGDLYARQGKMIEAEAMYRQALQGHDKTLSPEHPSASDIFQKLGDLYSRQGQMIKAEVMYQQALQRHDKKLSLEHPSASDIFQKLGDLYSRQGKMIEAEAMYGVLGLKQLSTSTMKLDISPKTLRMMVAGRRLDDVRRILEEHFDAVSKDEFIWLLELREHGYGNEEIAQLLISEESDSPWIFFEAREIPKHDVIPTHHQPFCVHLGGQGFGLSSNQMTSSVHGDAQSFNISLPIDEEDLKYIEESCGIAGVVPNSRNLNEWVGSVRFSGPDDHLTASVSFCSPLVVNEWHIEYNISPLLQLSTRVLKALENLCNGIGYAQKIGLCCDSFTTLGFIYGHRNIELRKVYFTSVLDLRSRFERFLADLQAGSGRPSMSLLREAVICASTILQETLHRQPYFSPNELITAEGLLSYCSLAVQLLSLAFLSYSNAHGGSIHPFFLDTPIHNFKFFGCQDPKLGVHDFTASLFRLTCLDNMLHSPVLVFYNGPIIMPFDRYDIVACPEDLVDTWGPGQFIHSSSEASKQNMTAILIGGGVIKPTSETTNVLHWSSDVEPRHKFSMRFNSKAKVMIGGGVEVNQTCQASRTARWTSFEGSMSNLGTTPEYWRFTEFQAGLAVMGQQLAGGQIQFNKTWTWHPGNSWKRQYLGLLVDELPLSELDRPWGLQVSFCTGVARRVPLRLLLADVLPSFAENLALSPSWPRLQQLGIISALEESGDFFKQWYNNLGSLANSQVLQTLTRRLIKHILLVLRDTGTDREHKTFLIACPQNGTTSQPITMCLPVQCENSSLWAKILADSEHCATFAYMTTLCLVSHEHKCQQTNPWHCPSLDTAVQQLHLRNEPIVMRQQAWNLDVNSVYWIGKPESGLRAKVVRLAGSPFPRLYISKSTVPEKTRARLGTMGRIFGSKMEHLRERQFSSWPAEDVLIVS